MKLTKEIVKHFEHEQAGYGTEVALHNIIWSIASDMLKDLGITKIRTYHGKSGKTKKI